MRIYCCLGLQSSLTKQKALAKILSLPVVCMDMKVKTTGTGSVFGNLVTWLICSPTQLFNAFKNDVVSILSLLAKQCIMNTSRDAGNSELTTKVANLLN